MIALRNRKLSKCRIIRMQCFENSRLVSCYYFANETKNKMRSSIPYARFKDLHEALQRGDVIWNEETE